MRKYYFFVFVVISISFRGQNFFWARDIGAPQFGTGKAVALDNANNIYAIGAFTGLFDFDPGPGTYLLSSSTGGSAIILVHDPAGNLLWVKQVPGTVTLNDIFIDPSNNIYITGNFLGTADFDPGPGSYTLNASGSNDVFVLKLDPVGNFIWAKQMGGIGSENGMAISVDASGNVFTTGVYNSGGDYDPGVSTYTLSHLGGNDIFISKLDAAGNFAWARKISSADSEVSKGIVIDGAGDICVTGYFRGTTNFNSTGSYTMASTSLSRHDVFVCKFDNAGNFNWAKQMGGSLSEDYAFAIAVDAGNNIYTTGTFDAAGDYDPGAGTYIIGPTGGSDAFISKLDASGNFIWANVIGGSASTSSEEGYSIFIGPNGNVYTTGEFMGTADFNPGPATFSITAYSSADIFISVLDPFGNFIWAGRMGGFGSLDYGYDIAVDSYLSIITTGRFDGTTVDFDPGPGVYNMSNGGGGNQNGFISKLVTCTASPSTPLAISGNTILCEGSITGYSISPVSGAGSYNWSLPSGWSGASANTSISATSSSVSGTISVSAVNPCGTSASQTLNVIVNAKPSLTVSSTATIICPGSSATLTANGATTYTWNTGPVNATIVATPSINSTYSVNGTDVNGCMNTNTINIYLYPSPNITASAVQSTVCSGATGCLSGNGSVFYTWVGPCGFTSNTQNPCIPSMSIACGCTFTLFGSDMNGCADTATTCITVAPLPTVTAISSNSVICVGQSATITANGANTYTWNTSSNNYSIAVSPTVTSNYSVTGTDLNGCTGSASLTQTVSTCIGVYEIGKKDRPVVFPNPGEGVFNIKFYKTKKIEVLNILSEAIHLFELKNEDGELSFDITDLPDGIYFIKINYVTGNSELIRLVKK